MVKKITYSSAKGIYVQKKMNEGMSNKQARKAWKKSQEKKAFGKYYNPLRGFF